MADVAVEVNAISKKFRKGEIFNSLRDLLPALARKVVWNHRGGELDRSAFWALKDVSFQVQRGDVLGIIGRNGAGKSTMLKLLSRILKPTSGSLTIHGNLSALIEIGAGFHPDLTGRENIYLNGAILGMRKRDIDRKFDEIVDFSGLHEFIDTPVKRYSSGMYARLGFSVAAHVNPDVLLVDEVLSVGDYLFQNKCLEKMRSITDSGATVIFVSHNIKAVADLCRSTILLEEGRVAKAGPTADVIRYYLDRGGRELDREEDKDAYVAGVRIRNASGEGFQFESGERVWIDIDVRARRPCEKLSLSIYIEDNEMCNLFDTSTERLGLGTFSLVPGQVFRCTYELHLHLANGLFHLGVMVYRYDIQQEYDVRFPAATIHVTVPYDVRGCVNLYPKVECSVSANGGDSIGSEDSVLPQAGRRLFGLPGGSR